MKDFTELRKDFPILWRRVGDKTLVYLDSAATSQKPRQVIEAMVRHYEERNANVHRGIYRLAEEATRAQEEARKAVAEWIGATDAAEVVFTKNTTESINLVAYGWGRKFLRPGDEILVSIMEHHSNLVPWQQCAMATGATLRHIDVTPEGLLDALDLDRLFTPRTRLVVLTHVSNVLGTINPVETLAAAAHRVGAKVVVDGAQSVPHMAVNVKTLGCDFFAFSAHKMLGPAGVGVLWAKKAELAATDPLLTGGDMIREVWQDRAEWNEIPYKFEAGTQNTPAIVGLHAAIQYLRRIGMEEVRNHGYRLTRRFLEILREDGRAQIYGPPSANLRGPLVSFNLGEIHPHDVATIFDQMGICVRAGHHCCQPLMKRMGLQGTVRASFHVYTTEEELGRVPAAIDRVERIFGRLPRSAGRKFGPAVSRATPPAQVPSSEDGCPGQEVQNAKRPDSGR